MRQTTSRRLKIQFVYQNLVLAEVLQRWAKHDWSLPTLYFRSILWYLWRGWFDWCCRQGSQFNATATPHKDAHKHIVRYTHSKRHMYVAYIYIFVSTKKMNIWVPSVSASAKDNNCEGTSFSTSDTTQLPDAASDLAAILSGFGCFWDLVGIFCQKVRTKVTVRCSWDRPLAALPFR